MSTLILEKVKRGNIMKKHFIYIAIIIHIIINLCSCNNNNIEENIITNDTVDTVKNIIEYKIENSECMITLYNGSQTDVIIPDEINGVKVTAIGERAFYNNEILQKITLPNTIKKIYDSAFSWCFNLSETNIPEELEYIGNYAFYRTSISEFKLPENITYLGEGAFGSTQITTLIIPAGTTEIGPEMFSSTNVDLSVLNDDIEKIREYAFGNCQNIYEFNVSDNVKSIGDAAFIKCLNLSKVYIGKNIEYIGVQAFANTNIKEYIVDEENPYYKSVDGVLYNHDMTELLAYPTKKNDNVFVIPESVTDIAQGAFQYQSYVTEVIIPKTITCIKWATFRISAQLKKIVIPDGVTKLEGDIFSYCDSLYDLYLPDSITEIDSTFYVECPNLTIHCSEDNNVYKELGTRMFNTAKFVFDYPN